MEKNELVITTAKDIFLRLFDMKEPIVVLGLSAKSGKEDFISSLGDQFKLITKKVSEAFNELK